MQQPIEGSSHHNSSAIYRMALQTIQTIQTLENEYADREGHLQTALQNLNACLNLSDGQIIKIFMKEYMEKIPPTGFLGPIPKELVKQPYPDYIYSREHPQWGPLPPECLPCKVEVNQERILRPDFEIFIPSFFCRKIALFLYEAQDIFINKVESLITRVWKELQKNPGKWMEASEDDVPVKELIKALTDARHVPFELFYDCLVNRGGMEELHDGMISRLLKHFRNLAGDLYVTAKEDKQFWFAQKIRRLDDVCTGLPVADQRINIKMEDLFNQSQKDKEYEINQALASSVWFHGNISSEFVTECMYKLINTLNVCFKISAKSEENKQRMQPHFESALTHMSFCINTLGHLISKEWLKDIIKNRSIPREIKDCIQLLVKPDEKNFFSFFTCSQAASSYLDRDTTALIKTKIVELAFHEYDSTKTGNM